jgi:hypothetical protein
MERRASALSGVRVGRIPWLAVTLTWTMMLAAPGRVLSQDGGERARFRLLPEGVLYDPYRAGDKEPRASASLLTGENGSIFLDAVLGGGFGIVRYGTESPSGPSAVQLDVEGAAFPRLNLRHVSQSVESVDFRFGFPLTARAGPVAVKTGYYHISSHVGDEYLERNPGFTRRNYVRDAVQTGVTYNHSSWLTAYGEMGYAFYTSGGAKPWELQLGGELHPRLEGCRCGHPFLAVHGHFREDADFGGSLNLVLGSEWRSPDGDRRLGLGLRFFDGYSSQYQFFDRQEELVGLAFWLGH